MGRSFTDEETSLQTDKVVILTDAYWRQHFDADPHVIGRQLRVNGLRNTVVGVLPPGFRFLSSEARLYFPFSSRPEDRASAQRHSGGNSKHMIARLKPGATLAQAQAQIDAQNATLEADDPEAKMMADAGFRSVVAPLHADHVRTHPPRPVVDAGGRLRPVADRRGQPDEPAFDPGEQPFEGNRCPAGVGREPVARGKRGDRRDHFAHAGRRPARARRRGRRNPPAECVGCRSFTFGESHRDRLSVGVRRGSRSRRHGTRARGAHRVVQPARPSEQARSNRRPAAERPAAPLKACATALSWRRSRWQRFC